MFFSLWIFKEKNKNLIGFKTQFILNSAEHSPEAYSQIWAIVYTKDNSCRNLAISFAVS